MSGKLSKNITTEISLEIVAIKVLIEAYKIIILKSKYDLDWEEEQFSAYIFPFMQATGLAKKHNLVIGIEEKLLQKNKLPIGNNNPKKAPRIDIYIASWLFKKDDISKYYFEAKNLSQNPRSKSTGTKVDANALQRRYIKTGIENFRKDRYYDGSLVGYVLEGEIDAIVDKLNERLLKDSNTIDKITKTKKDYSYESKHLTKLKEEMIIKHIFLKFNT